MKIIQLKQHIAINRYCYTIHIMFIAAFTFINDFSSTFRFIFHIFDKFIKITAATCSGCFVPVLVFTFILIFIIQSIVTIVIQFSIIVILIIIFFFVIVSIILLIIITFILHIFIGVRIRIIIIVVILISTSCDKRDRKQQCDNHHQPFPVHLYSSICINLS